MALLSLELLSLCGWRHEGCHCSSMGSAFEEVRRWLSLFLFRALGEPQPSAAESEEERGQEGWE